MEPAERYFLGANTPVGFYSLYSGLLPPEEARGLYILKGGPGCGKSTLMKKLSRRAGELGLKREEILCSGDPDSLDALILPELGSAVADGTSPHALEARFPGVVDHYVNLEPCYDSKGLQAVREEIFRSKKEYQEAYRRAYRCLEGAAALAEDDRRPLLTGELEEKLRLRARSVARREFPKAKGTPGRVRQRFLSTPTCRGTVTLWDTAKESCGRVWLLADRWGFAHEFLTALTAEAVERGLSPVVCPDPMAPDRMLHLLLPEIGAAFLTEGEGFGAKPYRRLRLESMADPELLLKNRPMLRFSRRVEEELKAQAVRELEKAKAGHDRLEAFYHPFVDFEGVEKLGKALEEDIFS